MPQLPSAATQTSSSRPPQLPETGDYTVLQQLLGDGNWKAANEYTSRIMFQAANAVRSNRNINQDWLAPDDIRMIPCEDFNIVNQLWVDASENRLGFTVQSELWRSVGGSEAASPDKPEVRKRFSDKIEWLGADEGQFSLSTLYARVQNKTPKDFPKGYLPSTFGEFIGDQIFVGVLNEFSALTKRLQECGISAE